VGIFLRYLIFFSLEIAWLGKDDVWQLREGFWAQSVCHMPRAPVICKTVYILWAWSLHRNFQVQVIVATNKRWKTNTWASEQTKISGKVDIDKTNL